LCRALPQVLHHSREEQTPGEEPDEMQRPVCDCWELVVILRVTLAEKAQQVLVDEVEPEKSRIAHSGQDVPRSRYQQEEKRARNKMKFAPPLPFTCDEQIRKQRACNKDDRYQSLGQNG